jgi:hypothetical protein
MSNPNATTEVLNALAKIFLCCTIFGFLLLLIWFAGYMLAPGMIEWQGTWFDLTPHEVGVIHYVGMAFVKSCVLLFFLFPYVSIRLVLKGMGTSAPGH